jgi:hypothetical protein
MNLTGEVLFASSWEGYARWTDRRSWVMRAFRPAVVIRTLPTSINLLPARTFSRVRLASPLLTKPTIMLTQKPCAMSSVCEAPPRPALASIANARHCSAVRLIPVSPVRCLKKVCRSHRPGVRSHHVLRRGGRKSARRIVREIAEDSHVLVKAPASQRLSSFCPTAGKGMLRSWE